MMASTSATGNHFGRRLAEEGPVSSASSGSRNARSCGEACVEVCGCLHDQIPIEAGRLRVGGCGEADLVLVSRGILHEPLSSAPSSDRTDSEWLNDGRTPPTHRLFQPLTQENRGLLAVAAPARRSRARR